MYNCVLTLLIGNVTQSAVEVSLPLVLMWELLKDGQVVSIQSLIKFHVESYGCLLNWIYQISMIEWWWKWNGRVVEVRIFIIYFAPFTKLAAGRSSRQDSVLRHKLCLNCQSLRSIVLHIWYYDNAVVSILSAFVNSSCALWVGLT
jgi:hypothetical protein